MVRVGVGSLRVCEVKPPHVEYAAAAAADDDDGYAILLLLMTLLTRMRLQPARDKRRSSNR